MTIGRSGSGRSGSGSLTWFDSRANEVKLTQLRSICLVDKDEIHTIAAQLCGGDDGHVLWQGARLQGNQGGVEAGAAQPGLVGGFVLRGKLRVALALLTLR